MESIGDDRRLLSFINPTYGVISKHKNDTLLSAQAVRYSNAYTILKNKAYQTAKFMGPIWGPPGSCRPQMGPLLAPWTLLPGMHIVTRYYPIPHLFKEKQWVDIVWTQSLYQTAAINVSFAADIRDTVNIEAWRHIHVSLYWAIIDSDDSLFGANPWFELMMACDTMDRR